MSPDHIPSRKRLTQVAACGLTLAAALVINGLVSRNSQAQAVTNWTTAQAIPVVQVVKPTGSEDSTLRLPARLDAWSQAQIYARVTGYLKSWNTDIGIRVEANQVLGEIDTPELNQQVAQAKARLEQVQSNLRIAETTANRWKNLLSTHSVSQQDVDVKLGAADGARSDAAAATADYGRLTDLVSFKTLRAPFAGTVTARNVDIGHLVTADAGGGLALFSIADIRRLRLYVQIPQDYVSVIHPGLTVDLTVPEHPGQRFKATLAGNSTSIDPRTGALTAQFTADNPDGALLAGSYAQVTFKVPSNPNAVTIPASALVFRASGTQVAVLGKDDHVHMHTVHIGMDLGNQLMIDQGINADDQVIDSPPDSLGENDVVKLSDQEASNATKA